MTDEDYKINYNKGLSLFETRNFYDAIPYFMISKDSKEYRKQSLNYLVLIKIYTTNYKEARKILTEYKDELYFDYSTTYSFLEKIEFNLNNSINIIIDSFKNSNSPNKKLSYLADCYIELGEYDIARKILETITLSPCFLDANIKLIYLDILESDFVNALKLFRSIEDYLDLDTYNQINALISYHIGTIHDTKDLKKDIYYVKRLLFADEKILINHLKYRHLNRIDNQKEGIFFRDTDLVKLLEIVKERIKEINPSFDRNAFIYNLEFPNLIGYNIGIPTNSIKVITAVGTNKIITMYPSILSNEFNQEGLLESKELMLKRGLKCKN